MTGAYTGTIGEVADTSAIVCESGSLVVGQAAPAFCSGGLWNAASHAPGGFSGPTGVHADASFVYVVDFINGSVQRFELTGAFAGWKGIVQTPPTGGDAGCTQAAVGTFTNGWCLGGSFDRTLGNSTVGQLSYPKHIGGDDRYLYVADGGNHRIVRIAK